jgi:RNA polymerase-binding transcription factor DksA
MQRVANGSKTRGKSSTSDILGNTVRNGNFNRKWAQHFRMLTMLRERFVRDLNSRSETAREELPGYSEHMADAATDSYDRDCELAMLSSSQTLLYEIEQALNRISNGTYGVCEATGKPIEPERLTAVPWTRFTTAAQNAFEEKGALKGPHLGELGSVVTSDRAEEVDDEESEQVPANGHRSKKD